MQDLAARVGREVADPAALGEAGVRLAASAPGLRLSPGEYLFATVHRAENREPDNLRCWTDLLDTVALPERPVVLAIHPGTRVAMERAGVGLGPDVFLVEPQGYRTSLALQLHAAAVLTDSGGVQREAAWLGVPCLVLRDTTEWVEAVAASAGRMVVIGLDAALAVESLARLAPESAPELALARAAAFALPSAGAAEAIVAALERGA